MDDASSLNLRDIVAFRISGGLEKLCIELREKKYAPTAELAVLRHVCTEDEDTATDVTAYRRILMEVAGKFPDHAESVYDILALLWNAVPSLERRPPPDRIAIDDEILWIRSVPTRQSAQRDTGFILWPAALVLARYLRRERHLVEGFEVLELGAGAGLSGLSCARFASNVILTDSNDACLTNLKYNARLNSDRCDVQHLDFAHVDDDDDSRTYHRIIASDIVCCVDDAVALARALAVLLADDNGVALIALPNPRHRYGVDQFPTSLTANGLAFTSISTNDDPDLTTGLDDDLRFYFEWRIFSITKS